MSRSALEGVCRCMVDARGYQHAWAFARRLRRSGNMGRGRRRRVVAAAGRTNAARRRSTVHSSVLRQAGHRDCRRRALRFRRLPVVRQVQDSDAVAVPIQHAGTIYGVLAVTLPKGLARDSRNRPCWKRSPETWVSPCTVSPSKTGVRWPKSGYGQAEISCGINEVFQEAFTCDTEAKLPQMPRGGREAHPEPVRLRRRNQRRRPS